MSDGSTQSNLLTAVLIKNLNNASKSAQDLIDYGKSVDMFKHPLFHHADDIVLMIKECLAELEDFKDF